MRAGTIQFESVSKTYGSKAAVSDVSFDIDEGEFFSIVGPSGSGKSTTLMMLAGFVVPSSGDIKIGSRSVVGLPPQKRDLGMMFQSYAVFPHLSVARNISFALEIRRRPRDEIQREVDRALKLVKLSGYQDRSPRSLSGGELQRVALARAIVFRPRVLLMDEPLSALDRELRSHMQLELKGIQRELGVTVVYVTHDQSEALAMSDKLAVMNHGRLEQVGPPHKLYENPETRFVPGFLGESNLLQALVVAREGQLVRARTPSGHIIVGHSEKDFSINDSITFAVRPEKLNVSTQSQPKESNYLTGRVRASNYGGDFIRYSLSTDDAELIVKLPNRADVATFSIGQTLNVSWTTADTSIFRGG